MEAMLLERWLTYWNWLFYGLLAVSTGVAAADAGGAGERVAIVALAAGLAVWYWRVVVRGSRFGVGIGAALPSLAIAAALWVPLLLLHWLFQLLMFNAYQLACSAPVPARRAVSAIAVVSAIVVATESVRRGSLDPLQLVFYGAVTLALGLFVAMTNAISEQSEERKRLIGELEAARQELAESERRAGALDERQRLAREIHDTLAQGFASIVTLCEAARAEFPIGAMSSCGVWTRWGGRRGRAWPKPGASSRRSDPKRWRTERSRARSPSSQTASGRRPASPSRA